MHLGHVARCVFHDALRGDEVGVAQANFFARREAIVLGRRNLAEIVVLNIKLAREWHLARAGRWIFRVVGHVDKFLFALGVVVDDQFERVQHGHGPAGAVVQVVTLEVLKHFDIRRCRWSARRRWRHRMREWPQA